MTVPASPQSPVTPVTPVPRQATFSIAVVDPATGISGVATASRYIAVGSLVLHARAEAGAILTQSIADRSHGERGLPMLAAGTPPRGVVEFLLAGDQRAGLRQIAAVNSVGETAWYTGAQCTPLSAAVEQPATADTPGLVALGNMLSHRVVPEAMAAAFLSVYHREASLVVPDPLGGSNTAMPADEAARVRTGANRMAEALLAALVAGEAAGGDRRGKQAAGLLVVASGAGYSGRDDRAVDLRVDDHPTPIQELDRVFRVFLDNQQREFAE